MVGCKCRTSPPDRQEVDHIEFRSRGDKRRRGKLNRLKGRLCEATGPVVSNYLSATIRFAADTIASSDAATILVLMPTPNSRPPGCSIST